jgi:hypothetical protein
MSNLWTSTARTRKFRSNMKRKGRPRKNAMKTGRDFRRAKRKEVDTSTMVWFKNTSQFNPPKKEKLNEHIYKEDAVVSKFSSLKNRALVRKIDNKELDIRTVMKSMVDSGQITYKEYSMMDYMDARRWLVCNQVTYTYEENK